MKARVNISRYKYGGNTKGVDSKDGNPRQLDIVNNYLETFDENANDGCYFPLLKKIKSNRWKHDSFDKSKSL